MYIIGKQEVDQKKETIESGNGRGYRVIALAKSLWNNDIYSG